MGGGVFHPCEGSRDAVLERRLSSKCLSLGRHEHLSRSPHSHGNPSVVVHICDFSAGKARTARALKPGAQLVNSRLSETPSQMIKQEAIEEDTRHQALVWTLSHTSTNAHRYHTHVRARYGGLKFIVISVRISSLRGQASATPAFSCCLSL